MIAITSAAIVAGLVGLGIGLLVRHKPPSAGVRVTAGHDFVTAVARGLGVDPAGLYLTGVSVDAGVTDAVATVLFQALAVARPPDQVERAVIDAIRRAVLKNQADADRVLLNALDALRDDLTDAATQKGPEAAALAAEARDALTSALAAWATATLPNVQVDVRLAPNEGGNQ
jgi:hypothetical protein